MTDTADTVGDLDAETTVYFVGRRAGQPGRVVHLTDDCYRLSNAEWVDSHTARKEHQTTDVCSTCAGKSLDGVGDQDWSTYRALKEASADD
jgi:hypothetical protein